MKKMKNIRVWAGALLVLFAASSCSDFLDINENPNLPTTADPELVLPLAIVATASRASTYNGGNYGAHFGGFMANAGGFSGFGTLLNYNLVPGDYNGLWTGTYTGPLADLQFVIDKTEGDAVYAFYNAAAKIIQVVNYQQLVDAFGDIPYSKALDRNNTTPAYDDAAEVYQNLIAKLDEAIAQIDANPVAPAIAVAADPLFGKLYNTTDGANVQMLEWKRYANTLKLRMLIRSNGSLTSVVKTFKEKLNGEGADVSAFLSDDAVVNPGYELNKPNPDWASWGLTTATAPTPVNRSRVPTHFAFGFYGGTKILDNGRGKVMYYNFPGTPRNQLGDEANEGNVAAPSNASVWVTNAPGFAGTGALKRYDAGRPLMLLAESKFLLAEAALKGTVVEGGYEANFYAGVTASFRYLYKTPSGALLTGADPDVLVANYIAENGANPNKRLVVIEEATSDAQRLEAIITQKYIALNMTNNDEAWNEYRRTGYPATVKGGTPAADIASIKSSITTRPDGLPTRVMYPSSEQQYNPANYRGIDYRSERIFWDPN